jgi:acyl-CoA reductase-like NAD-dependent aldehyde dehydrogenase
MADIAKHWIDGEWVDSDTVSESINPATGEVLGEWYDGGEAEAEAAIAAARRAFDTTQWSRDRSLRHRALSEMADRFDSYADELGRLVTKENGKKLAEGMFESSTAGMTLRYNASEALTEAGISAEVSPGLWFSQYSEPAGVVGIIVPWNAPVALFIRSLAPALAAGNTVALKMPGQTALVANRLSQIIAEVGSLPTGVVNIFTESGNSGAPYLVASPDIQIISYTGSVPVGRIVAADGAPTLKRMNLELGGKTPMIVFDDAALDLAIPLVASAVTTFAGQFCMTGSRILVQRGSLTTCGRVLVRFLKTSGSVTDLILIPIWARLSTSRTSPGLTAWSRLPSLTPSRSYGAAQPPRAPSPRERSFGRPFWRSMTSTPKSSRRKSLDRSPLSKCSIRRPMPSLARTPQKWDWPPAFSPNLSPQVDA